MDDTTLHVIICSWKRLDSLSELLHCFINQTYKDFKISIVNNSIDKRDIVEGLVKKYETYFSISVIHNNTICFIHKL